MNHFPASFDPKTFADNYNIIGISFNIQWNGASVGVSRIRLRLRANFPFYLVQAPSNFVGGNLVTRGAYPSKNVIDIQGQMIGAGAVTGIVYREFAYPVGFSAWQPSDLSSFHECETDRLDVAVNTDGRLSHLWALAPVNWKG